MTHPNATVAGVSTAPSLLLVWLSGYFGLNLSAELGVAIAGTVTTVALFVGRHGIAGVLRMLWRGQPPVNG